MKKYIQTHLTWYLDWIAIRVDWTPYVPPVPPEKPLISPSHITEPQVGRPLIR